MPDLNNKKTAIYIRVSTHWQVDKDSLQVQERELLAYNEMVLGIPRYEIFRDAGYSAKNTDRPEFQRMMSRVRKGEFSHILVWKIDRISRNLLDFTTMYSELKQLGVAFISKNEQFDTSSAIGEAMLKIILVFAELERNMTAERVTSVMLSRANNGQWNGGKIPYGYNWDKVMKSFTINEEEAKIVKYIFTTYLAERSLNQVAKILNSEGYRSRKDAAWSTTTVHTILTNPFYVGKYRYNVHPGGGRARTNDEKEWVLIDNHHEAIIDDVTFEKVKNILYAQRRLGDNFFRTYKRENVHFFAALCRCGVCGSNMSATKDKRRESGYCPSMYGCADRRRRAGCNNTFISDSKLGPFMINLVANIMRLEDRVSINTPYDKIQNMILSGDAFANVISIERTGLIELKKVIVSKPEEENFRPSLITKLSQSNKNDTTYLEQQIRKEEGALKRLTTLYLYGDDTMPEKDFLSEKERISNRITQLQDQLKERVAENSQVDPSFVEKASYFLMKQKLLGTEYINFSNFVLTIDENVLRSFFRTILKQITITYGKVVSVQFQNNITLHFSYGP